MVSDHPPFKNGDYLSLNQKRLTAHKLLKTLETRKIGSLNLTRSKKTGLEKDTLIVCTLNQYEQYSEWWNTYLENSPSLNPLKYKASVKMAGCPVLNTGHRFVVFSSKLNLQPTMRGLDII